MAEDVGAILIGAGALVHELKRLGAIPEDEPFRNDLVRGARALRDELRAAAPKGPPDPSRFSWKARKAGLQEGAIPDRGTRYKGGNLRRGIIAGRAFGKKGPFAYKKENIAAYVGVNYRVAPHINFIERGARLKGFVPAIAGIRQGKGEKPYQTGKRALRLYGIKGAEVFSAWARPGPQAPKPFFRRVVDSNRAKYESYIGISAWNRVKGARWEYIKANG